MMDKLLDVEHITKIYSLGSVTSKIRITATDDVSFYIKPAEIFTLAGESGCGKTTTAKIVLGFEHPTSGTIVHNGTPYGPTNNDKVWFTEGVQAIFQDPFNTFNPLENGRSLFF